MSSNLTKISQNGKNLVKAQKLDPRASRNREKVHKDLIKPFIKLAECELNSGAIYDSALRMRGKWQKNLPKILLIVISTKMSSNLTKISQNQKKVLLKLKNQKILRLSPKKVHQDIYFLLVSKYVSKET